MSGWLALGLPTATAPSPPTAVDDFGGGGGSGGETGGGGGVRGRAFPGRPELCASVEEVAAAVAGFRWGGAPLKAGGANVTRADRGASPPPPPPQPPQAQAQAPPQAEAEAEAEAEAPPLLLGDARSWREYLGEGRDYGCNPNPLALALPHS